MSQGIHDRIKSDFAFHVGNQDSQMFFEECRKKHHELAQFIATCVPNGREQSTALTKLEESMFWANAGVARTNPIA